MKKLFLNLLLALPFAALSQFTTTNPDTVCYHTAGSIYKVPSLGVGYTYAWTVASPGTIVSGQGTDSIQVDWSIANPGLIPNAISVTATNSSGCTSQPVIVNVFILNIVPTITAIGPFCPGAPCVSLAGSPAGGTWLGAGVVNTQYCPNTTTTGNHTITYIITQGGCLFSTTSTVTINPTPVLLPISHN